MERILLKKLTIVPTPDEMIEFMNKELPEYRGEFIYLNKTIVHPTLEFHYDRINNVVSVEKP